MLELEVLIRKFGSIDGLASSAIEVGEIATLEHEVIDHPVEDGALVAKAFLSSACVVECMFSVSLLEVRSSC